MDEAEKARLRYNAAGLAFLRLALAASIAVGTYLSQPSWCDWWWMKYDKSCAAWTYFGGD